jgi:hypothetical protein
MSGRFKKGLQPAKEGGGAAAGAVVYNESRTIKICPTGLLAGRPGCGGGRDVHFLFAFSALRLTPAQVRANLKILLVATLAPST